MLIPSAEPDVGRLFFMKISELADEQVVDLAASMLSFVNLNKHTGLVVRVSREDFRFFGGSGGVKLDETAMTPPSPAVGKGGQRRKDEDLASSQRCRWLNSKRESISMDVWVVEERVRLARLRRQTAGDLRRGLSDKYDK